MLIPLGILSSSGGSADFELIATAYGDGSSGSITFSSIPQTYTHLQIRFATVLTTNASSQLCLRMNGVTTASYSMHRLYGNGSTAYSTGNSSTGYIQLIGESSGLSTVASAGVVDLYDYTNTNKNKTIRAMSAGRKDAFSREISLNSGAFMSTAAVSSLTLVTTGGVYATSTRFSLYGVKG